MKPSPLSWQALATTYPFDINNTTRHFLSFQPKAQQALTLFQQSNSGALLVLKSDVLPENLAEIRHTFQEKNIDCSFINHVERQKLFGYGVYIEKENKTKWIAGELEKNKEGVFILNLNSLLLDITLWDKIKHALLFGEFEPIATNAIPEYLPKINCSFKLLLVGSRDDISLLEEYDETLYQFAQYAELTHYLNLEQYSPQQWADYIQTLSRKFTQKTFSAQGLNQLFNQSIRESETRTLVSISPSYLKKQLLGLAVFFSEKSEFDHIQPYFDYLEQQSAVLNQYAVQDILNHQHYLETEDETIGQINGLSVVEFDGVPHAFGEPIRISCNVQFGDGEIHDIERKVELGGNIHAKGIFLAQSCLANLLELSTQLPFSATLAFEQSYSEIDGDSSSLAIFNVLLSALTKLPLPQSLAITGAIDQLGNVLSVGGVNQKIEGFFNICHARRLTGKQGVIIPMSCISHLSLCPTVIEAVKQKQFHIWAVRDVFEAVEILFHRPFYAEDAVEEKTALFELVHRQLENQHEAASGSIWHKFCKKWKR